MVAEASRVEVARNTSAGVLLTRRLADSPAARAASRGAASIAVMFEEGDGASAVGVYPGYAYPYTYGYVDPYYDPYYAAPAPAPVCNPNGGYYDANGNWIPEPNCDVPPPTAPVPYGY
jgi:hypothetical protein